MDETTRIDPLYHFTDEHRALRGAVTRFAATHLHDDALRSALETDRGHDRAVWARLGGELGVLGMSVPESLGGSGGTLVDQAAVVEELGAVLCPGPLVGTVYLGIPLLAAAPAGPARDALLPTLCDGSTTVAVAVEPGGGPAPQATARDGVWHVDGSLGAVVDGGTADHLVVLAATDEGAALFLVASEQEAVERRHLVTLDLTRRQADVVLAGAAAELLAEPALAGPVVQHALDVAAALLACEQLGASQHLLNASVAYAKERRQFGRAIGSFQAIKHKLADLLVLVEHARSAAYHAAWALAENRSTASLEASIAQAICSDAFAKVAADTVQIHGGIGFTWEHEAHLYLKRAVTDAALFGSAEVHRNRVAEDVLDVPKGAYLGMPPPVAVG